MQIIRTLTQQQELFCSWVSTPLRNIAERCATSWSRDRSSLALLTELQESMRLLPQYALCYLISPEGTILTPTISHAGTEPTDVGNDVSLRPYFLEWSSPQRSHDFFLTRPYISTKTGFSCMTAMQAVRIDGEVFAIIAIDFDGNSSLKPAFHATHHIQIKGDPSIRQQLFSQTRAISAMEEQIDETHRAATNLFLHHGAFHIQLRYSRSNATARFTEHPYHDTLFSLEQLIESDTVNRQPITSMTTVAPPQIGAALSLFKSLRLADENIYLRSGSLNIISGIVELNFSCDGTHQIPVDDFLQKSTSYWLTDIPPCPDRTHSATESAPLQSPSHEEPRAKSHYAVA